MSSHDVQPLSIPPPSRFQPSSRSRSRSRSSSLEKASTNRWSYSIAEATGPTSANSEVTFVPSSAATRPDPKSYDTPETRKPLPGPSVSLQSSVSARLASAAADRDLVPLHASCSEAAAGSEAAAQPLAVLHEVERVLASAPSDVQLNVMRIMRSLSSTRVSHGRGRVEFDSGIRIPRIIDRDSGMSAPPPGYTSE